MLETAHWTLHLECHGQIVGRHEGNVSGIVVHGQVPEDADAPVLRHVRQDRVVKCATHRVEENVHAVGSGDLERLNDVLSSEGEGKRNLHDGVQPHVRG